MQFVDLGEKTWRKSDKTLEKGPKENQITKTELLSNIVLPTDQTIPLTLQDTIPRFWWAPSAFWWAFMQWPG